MQTRGRELFANVSVEGAILPPDLLRRVLDGDKGLDGLAPDAYHLSGEKLGEAVSRSWVKLRAAWTAFAAAREKLPVSDAGTTLTREKWLLPLFQELGYGRLAVVKPENVGGKTYDISHSWRSVPIHLVTFRADLNRRAAVTGAQRSSPHGLLQEYLNRSEGHMWGFVSNGLQLRILRDNASLTRQAFVEFDLAAIMQGEAYSDFALLWLLCHQSRVEADRPEEFWLEKWSRAAQADGTRALDALRRGVERAIEALGIGFLAHPANGAIRDSLRSGALPAQDYYRQLLRLVYRMLFLFVAEDRDLLLLPSADGAARARFRHYSTRRLRMLASRVPGTPHADGWVALRLVMDWLGDDRGCPELGLPALGSFLWSKDALGALAAAELANRHLLDAVRAISFTDDGRSRRWVDYKNLGAEELGSVYESLLELVPTIDTGTGAFSLVTAGGNERKTTGSYYTPTSLVSCLLDSALAPVLDEAAAKPEPEKAILALKVVDPACGSGHFLIAAAHRIARRLAVVRAGVDEPAPPDVRHALRDVIGHCMYGVDINPMAVELCKVAMWMEAVEPGRPLSFLDSHIQQGNALLGATPDLLAKGIPDAAFEPIEGDDRKTASLLKKKNKAAGEGQRGLDSLWSKPDEAESAEVVKVVGAMEAAPDASLADVAGKEAQWEGLQRSLAFTHQKFIADAWCAAFVWPKPATEPKRIDPVVAAAPTNELWRQIRDGKGKPPTDTVKAVAELASRYHFFHWHLAFPQVFARGGFDLVLGNPPWERLTVRDQEWFAGRDPEVADAANAAERRKKIRELGSRRPDLAEEFLEEKRRSIGEKNFSRTSGYFPLAGVGDVNTFALFAETFLRVMSPAGYAGAILPTGIATTDTTKAYFSALVQGRRLRSLYDFDNRSGLFPAVQGNVRFCLLTLGPYRDGPFRVAAQLTSTELLRDQSRVYDLSADDIATINPGTLTCPLLASARDASIVRGIYRRVPVLEVEEGSATAGWRIAIARMLHMGDDAEHFKTEAQLREGGASRRGPRFIARDGTMFGPLYESKFCDRYNHRAATFDGIPLEDRFGTHPATRALTSEELARPDCLAVPRYWAPLRLAEDWANGRSLLLGFRNAVSATADSRSLNACIMPLHPAGDSVKFITTAPETDALALVAILNSFVVDYVFRQKATGGNASFFLIRQLPVLRRTQMDLPAPWDSRSTTLQWLVERVIELSCTTDDVVEWSPIGRPYRFDRERRASLSAELDAAVLHLYGISRSDADCILGRFPVLERAEVAEFSEFRSKRVILEIYDAMAKAIRTGERYQTRLDPPPADPRVAHPPRTSVRAAKPATVGALPDAAWQRPHIDHADEVGVVLVALLKAFGRATSVDEVRLAAVLALHPALALASLKRKEATEWRRLVGDEAEPLPRGVTAIAAATDRAWGEAVRHLRATRLLVENAAANTWAPGWGLDAIDTADWADGRAQWVVEMIQRRGVADVLQTMDPEIRRWVNGAEAA